MTAQAASRHAVLGLALFLATACGRGADSGRRPSLTAAVATVAPITPTAPLRAQAIVALRSTPTRPPETNTYADACPIFIACGNTHDPSLDFDAYIDVDYIAYSHANRNAATNCTAIPTMRPAIQTTAAANIRPFKPNAWSAADGYCLRTWGEGHYVDHAGSKLVPELGHRQPDPE